MKHKVGSHWYRILLPYELAQYMIASDPEHRGTRTSPLVLDFADILRQGGALGPVFNPDLTLADIPGAKVLSRYCTTDVKKDDLCITFD